MNEGEYKNMKRMNVRDVILNFVASLKLFFIF